MILVIACAAGALASTLYTGRHNPSWLLVGLFVVWVLAPYVAVAFYMMRRPAALALAVSVGSLLVYVYAAIGPGAHGAFLYLIVPAGCWAALGAMSLVNERFRRR